MKIVTCLAAFLALSPLAHAASLTCLPAKGDSAKYVEKGLIQGDSLTLVLSSGDGKSVTGALVSDPSLDEGERALDAKVARRAGLQASVITIEGHTILHVSQQFSMEVPQSLECK